MESNNAVAYQTLTCIVCPKGCQLTVGTDTNGKPISVSGNTCKRGDEYARNELTHPLRTVTSTVRTESGKVISVKTSAAIPKELIFEVMKEINKTAAKDCVKMNEVIIPNVCNTGADIISTVSTVQ